MKAKNFPRELELLKDRIETAGLTATLDPREVNPPCAWVMIDSLEPDTLCGGMAMKAAITLIAPDIGSPSYLYVLAEMLDTLTEVLVPEDITTTTATTPTSGSPLPALICTAEIGD